jgi:hypothetical protein
VIKEEVSTTPVPAANACVAQVIDITLAIVANMVAFFANLQPLESHLCFGFAVIADAVVSIAVSATAEMFIVSIGKSLLKIKIK